MSDAQSLVDVQSGKISRDIFVDEAIYRQELEAIFTRAWLFVGHESQVKNPGDFFTSRMGEESVILCRDKKGDIHVFLNSCRHRGMKVCRYDQGNTSLFTCPYHSWTYTTDGKLQGVPQYKALYEGALERENWSLVEVAKLKVYKGTVWATWDAQAPEFEVYMGDALTHLDQALDCRDGRPGGSEVVGVHKWIIPSNWKFASENFLGDTYHNPSHRSVDLIGIGPSSKGGKVGRRNDAELEQAEHVWVSFPQGHGVHSAIAPESNEYSPAYSSGSVSRVGGSGVSDCFDVGKWVSRPVLQRGNLCHGPHPPGAMIARRDFRFQRSGARRSQPRSTEVGSPRMAVFCCWHRPSARWGFAGGLRLALPIRGTLCG